MNIKQLINDTVTTDWKDFLLSIFNDTKALDDFLTNEKNTLDGHLEIFPPKELIFNAFNQFDKKNLKILLIGQDCYINKGEAMGLSFSVPEGIKIPPSLHNMYKELSTDLNIDTLQRNGDLTHWAKQGILLLNSALTVREGKSNSHQKYWTSYTNKLIEKISNDMDGLIFILWGNNAKEKIKYIDQNKHYIIQGVHPSPLSASKGFFGCKHFSKCNSILEAIGKDTIKW